MDRGWRDRDLMCRAGCALNLGRGCQDSSEGCGFSITISWRLSYAKYPIAEQRPHCSNVYAAHCFFRALRSQRAYCDRTIFGFGPAGVAHRGFERRAGLLVLNLVRACFNTDVRAGGASRLVSPDTVRRRRAGRPVYGEAGRACGAVGRGLTSVSAAASSWPSWE